MNLVLLNFKTFLNLIIIPTCMYKTLIFLVDNPSQ